MKVPCIMAANEEGFVSLKTTEASTNAKMHGKVLHISAIKGTTIFETHLSGRESEASGI